MAITKTNPNYLLSIASVPHLYRSLRRDHFDLIMQNKPNFQVAKMHITPYASRSYVNQCLRQQRKNKPNFNPIRTLQTPSSLASRPVGAVFSSFAAPRIAHPTIIMQNKPNFRKSQVHVTISIAKTCAKMDTWSQWKNKPNQTQFRTRRLKIYLQRQDAPRCSSYLGDVLTTAGGCVECFAVVVTGNQTTS